MNQNEDSKELLQWHPAFYAGLQVEFGEESQKLIFENEHNLGTKPKQIDVLIIKKNKKYAIKKNIGHLFRKHNIVEYKDPDDYLGIDDFYKVYAYACLYKSDTPSTDTIKINDITLSFVCSHYPRKLILHLQKAGNLNIIEYDKGIYHIIGDRFPIQLIVTSRLSKENNFWLRNLTNDIKDSNAVSEVVAEYKKHRNNKLYQSIMNIIIQANKESFMEVKEMCEAIRDLFKEEYEEGIRQNTELVTQQVTQQVTLQKIQSIMHHLKMNIEQAMDVLDIPTNERKLYI